MQKLLRGLQSNELGQCVVSENISFHVLTEGPPGVCMCMFVCVCVCVCVCVRVLACMHVFQITCVNASVQERVQKVALERPTVHPVTHPKTFTQKAL